MTMLKSEKETWMIISGYEVLISQIHSLLCVIILHVYHNFNTSSTLCRQFIIYKKNFSYRRAIAGRNIFPDFIRALKVLRRHATRRRSFKVHHRET